MYLLKKTTYHTHFQGKIPSNFTPSSIKQSSYFAHASLFPIWEVGGWVHW